jgi:putative FmdB family regulatory protein
MPIFEYKCGQCGHTFEALVNVSGADMDLSCPACGSTECEKQF